MEHFIGTKIVNAAPMTRDEFQNSRGRFVGGTETGEGYLVQYENGYESWSPKLVFEASYRRINNMTFSLALEALKQGHRVARLGWNGRDMFLFLVPGSIFKVNRPPLLGIFEEGNEIQYLPHIDLRNAQGSIGPWVPSQADILEEDYVLVGLKDV